jgi:D-alanyl-D-alanine carboxypeptidase (penicillin-binding protein 5/6)
VRLRRAGTVAGIALWIGATCAGAVDAAGAPSSSDPYAGVARAYRVSVDGRELWSSSAGAPQPPASLTKLMTALVAFDAMAPDEAVTVSAAAARARGARVGLVAGERFHAADLVTAMLVASGNDACHAIAEHVAGSEAAFVRRMNARARAMKLSATRFENACGFDGPTHRSSARDLARMAEALLERPLLARSVALPAATIHAIGGRALEVRNSNALIGRVPGAVGVKTGYTARAGRCLVGLVERDGVRVMIVLLGAGDRWWDAVAMIERAFEHAREAGARTASPPR